MVAVLLPRSTHQETNSVESLNWCCRCLVNLVNPKFKAFTRPLTLAVLVGFLTIATDIVILVLLLGNCQYLSYNGNILMFMKLLDSGTLTCILHFEPITVFNESLTSGTPCVFSGMTEDLFCESDTWEFSSLTACDEYDSLKMYFVEYESCPGRLASLGSALGFLGLFELGITCVVVPFLLSVGVLKLGNSFLLQELEEDLVDDLPHEDLIGATGAVRDVGFL